VNGAPESAIPAKSPKYYYARVIPGEVRNLVGLVGIVRGVGNFGLAGNT
jgi:hypothetical protein